LKDKWRIIEMPDHEADFPDVVEPTYILFDGKGGGEAYFTTRLWTTSSTAC